MAENPYQSPNTESGPPPKRGWRPGHLTSVLLAIGAIYLLNVLLFPRVPEALHTASLAAVAFGLIWIVGVLGVRAVVAISRPRPKEPHSPATLQ